MKFVLELNKDAERLFAQVIGTGDRQAIADDIHAILLAEFEWNAKYRHIWHELEDPEWFVYPVRETHRKRLRARGAKVPNG